MDITLHKILSLLWEKGESEIDFCNALGINKSAVTDWKKGKTKSYRKHLPAIAEHFGVNLDSITAETDIPETKKGSSEDESDAEMWELRREMAERSEMKTLFSLSKNATKEDIELVNEMLKRMGGGDSDE